MDNVKNCDSYIKISRIVLGPVRQESVSPEAEIKHREIDNTPNSETVV
jgi:hypothetical protein